MIRDRRVSRDLGENVANRVSMAIKANLEKKVNKVFRPPQYQTKITGSGDKTLVTL